jgi:hypothetical protein
VNPLRQSSHLVLVLQNTQGLNQPFKKNNRSRCKMKTYKREVGMSQENSNSIMGKYFWNIYTPVVTFLTVAGLVAVVAYTVPSSNPKAFSERKAVPSSVLRAQQVISSSFDFEDERRLTDLASKSLGASSLDEKNVEIINNNKENLTKIFEGEELALNTTNSSRNDDLSSDLEQGWIKAEEYMKKVEPFKNRRASKQDFEEAMSIYEKGISLKSYPADLNGNNFLKDAGLRFARILKSQPEPIIKEYSLYFLGDIGFHLWTENMDMPGAAYMIEAVRMTESHDLAERAWLKLNAQIHFGYSGSGGDRTPESWTQFLAQLQSMTEKENRLPIIGSL